MTDDGSGHNINIPAFFIRYEDREAIKVMLLRQSHVMLRISIETEMTNDGVADVVLWFSTIHELSEETL